MPTCQRCETTFEDEDAYLEHLETAHETEELGSIDRRRLEKKAKAEGPPDWFWKALGAGALFLLAAAIAWGASALLSGGGGGGDSGPQEPYDYGSVHEHGTLNVTIDGQTVDFSDSQYQLQNKYFHFEEGNGRVWHTHAKGVTLKYAMDTLDIGVTNSSVTFDGTTYTESDPNTSVTVTVNGESVTPSEYVLEGASAANPGQGDDIKILVTQKDA